MKSENQVLTYEQIRPKFQIPNVWRLDSESKLLDPPLTYQDCSEEIRSFEKLKEKIKKSLGDDVEKICLSSQDVNDLNRNLDNWGGILQKTLIATENYDPQWLLGKTNKATLDKKLQPWCLNLANNTERLIETHGIRRVLGKFLNVPCLVIAAGPSLINNINDLREVGYKGIILSCDTSYKPLIDRGIIPQFCMVHDANHAGAKFFLKENIFGNIDLNNCPTNVLQKCFDDLKTTDKKIDSSRTIGAFVNYVSPLTFEAFNGTRLIYEVMDPSLPVYRVMGQATQYMKQPDGSLKKDYKGAILGGSSVAHTCFYLAVEMGCNPIGFVGFDLSYPHPTLTHVEGSTNLKDISKKKLINVRDISGRKIKTDTSLYSYKVVIETMLPHFIMDRGIHIFNCTEGPDGRSAGIITVGMEPMKLKNFISSFCTKEYEILKNIHSLIPKKEEV